MPSATRMERETRDAKTRRTFKRVVLGLDDGETGRDAGAQRRTAPAMASSRRTWLDCEPLKHSTTAPDAARATRAWSEVGARCARTMASASAKVGRIRQDVRACDWTSFATWRVRHCAKRIVKTLRASSLVRDMTEASNVRLLGLLPRARNCAEGVLTTRNACDS